MFDYHLFYLVYDKTTEDDSGIWLLERAKTDEFETHFSSVRERLLSRQP